MYNIKLLFVTIVFTMITLYSFSQISISADSSLPDNSAMLDVKSGTKGILVPRMTIEQRNVISNPATGLMIFCTDDNQFYFNQGTPASSNWVVLNTQWTSASSNIFFNSGNVGIGNTVPNSMLSIGANNQFQVNSTGDITKINNIAINWPSSQGAVNSILVNDGAGHLAWSVLSPSGLKQVVRGVITLSSNTLVPHTFSATPLVVPSKCVIELRVVGDGNTQPNMGNYFIVSSLTSTTITLETGIFIGGLKLEYQIIEYY